MIAFPSLFHWFIVQVSLFAILVSRLKQEVTDELHLDVYQSILFRISCHNHSCSLQLAIISADVCHGQITGSSKSVIYQMNQIKT